MVYAHEVAKFSTRMLGAAVKPSVLREATTAELRHGVDSITVALERVHDRGCVRERLRFVCPGVVPSGEPCGRKVRTLGWAYGRWGCRLCLAWRTRGKRPLQCEKAPHIGEVDATAGR